MIGDTAPTMTTPSAAGTGGTTGMEQQNNRTAEQQYQPHIHLVQVREGG